MTSHLPTPATLRAQAATTRLNRYLRRMEKLAQRKMGQAETLSPGRAEFERAYPLEPRP